MVMIQKQIHNRHSGGAQNHQEEKGAASLEFNKEDVNCFFSA
jgi:hypothetical protein